MGNELTRNGAGFFTKSGAVVRSTMSLNKSDGMNKDEPPPPPPPPAYDLLRNNSFIPAYATYEYRINE